MITSNLDLSLAELTLLERRFDGPIPLFLLNGNSAHLLRDDNQLGIHTKMKRCHRREIWHHLARTKSALADSNNMSADHHRAHLDAAARNLASVISSAHS